MKKYNFICLFSAFILLLTAAGEACAEPRSRILFIGDVMSHIQQIDAAERKGDEYDFSPQFIRVRPLLDGAFVVGNLETTFSGKKVGYAGYPRFNTPDSLAPVLKELGLDVLTLANNHIFDRGASGARRTAEVLNRENIPWTGLGFDDIPANDALLVEAEGLRWAFVNFTYGSNLYPKSSDVHLNIISDAAIGEGLRRARLLEPDVIAACFHWGNEYVYAPTSHQKKAAEAALAGGADLVIGTHPHVLQPVEIRTDADGKPRVIAWSLGNFISYQRTLPRERTCVLSAEFERTEGKARLVRIAAAPIQVITAAHNKKLVQPTYAGTGGNFNHHGLSGSALAKIRSAGRNVLDFLGAQDEIDEYGFYTLWSAEAPEKLPLPRRKSPM